MKKNDLISIYKEKRQLYKNEGVSVMYFLPNSSVQIINEELKEALIFHYPQNTLSEGRYPAEIYYKKYLYDRGTGIKVFSQNENDTIEHPNMSAFLEEILKKESVKELLQEKSEYTLENNDSASGLLSGIDYSVSVVKAVRHNNELFILETKKEDDKEVTVEVPIQETKFKDWHQYEAKSNEISFLVKDEKRFLEITRDLSITQIADILMVNEEEVSFLIEKVQDTLVRNFEKEEELKESLKNEILIIEEQEER